MRAFCDTSLSSHFGGVAGALMVTLGCVRPVALSCPPARVSTSSRAGGDYESFEQPAFQRGETLLRMTQWFFPLDR